MKKKTDWKLWNTVKKWSNCRRSQQLFSDIITNLKLPPYEDPATNAENIADLILKVIEKYKNHPNIKIINDKDKTNSVFTFYQVSLEEI